MGPGRDQLATPGSAVRLASVMNILNSSRQILKSDKKNYLQKINKLTKHLPDLGDDLNKPLAYCQILSTFKLALYLCMYHVLYLNKILFKPTFCLLVNFLLIYHFFAINLVNSIVQDHIH